MLALGSSGQLWPVAREVVSGGSGGFSSRALMLWLTRFLEALGLGLLGDMDTGQEALDPHPNLPWKPEQEGKCLLFCASLCAPPPSSPLG